MPARGQLARRMTTNLNRGSLRHTKDVRIFILTKLVDPLSREQTAMLINHVCHLAYGTYTFIFVVEILVTIFQCYQKLVILLLFIIISEIY